jgi:hypothetical protein
VGHPYYKGSLLKLTVADDGTASGRIVGTSAFMWLRDQRTLSRVLDRIEVNAEAEVRITELHPYEPISNYDAAFAIGLQVPHCQVTLTRAGDDPQDYVLYLIDLNSRSWASLTHTPGSDVYPVRQHGPRRLWNEVETAHRWWTTNGRPAFTRFGLTITPDEQRAWFDTPTGPSWPIV